MRGDVGAWTTGGKAGGQVQVVDAHETLVQRGVQDTDRRVAPKPWHEIRQRAYGSREAKPVDFHDVFRGQIPPVELHSVVLVPLVSAGKNDVDRLWVGVCTGDPYESRRRPQAEYRPRSVEEKCSVSTRFPGQSVEQVGVDEVDAAVQPAVLASTNPAPDVVVVQSEPSKLPNVHDLVRGNG